MDVSIETRPAVSTRDQISVTLIAVLVLFGSVAFLLFLLLDPMVGRVLVCSFEGVGVAVFFWQWHRGWKDYPPWSRRKWTAGWASLYAVTLFTILRDFISLAHDLALGKLLGLVP